MIPLNPKPIFAAPFVPAKPISFVGDLDLDLL
jgi:hypothetical protein